MKIQDFDFSINVLKALLWRHNEAENLQALMQNKQDALDELNADFWTSWVTDVFDLTTANAFGLSVWSIILDLPLSISPTAQEDNNSNFGFGPFRKNFNNGNFSSATDTINLDVEEARIALRLRFYQLVTRGTIPECNKIVIDIFGDTGEVYCLDGLDMTISYVFNYYPTASIRLVLERFDLLPRPSSVKVKTIYFPNSAFGFGPFRKNFNNGNFRG